MVIQVGFERILSCLFLLKYNVFLYYYFIINVYFYPLTKKITLACISCPLVVYALKFYSYFMLLFYKDPHVNNTAAIDY